MFPRLAVLEPHYRGFCTWAHGQGSGRSTVMYSSENFGELSLEVLRDWLAPHYRDM